MHNVLENLEIDELNKIDLDTEYEQAKKDSNFKAITKNFTFVMHLLLHQSNSSNLYNFSTWSRIALYCSDVSSGIFSFV